MPDPDPRQAASDARFMAAAIRLGRRELGRTWPNPAVGCLIAADRHGTPAIVGRGWTRKGGRPHAETVALGEAGDAARGATAYVSLEPCAHHGRTPPCADALIASGVARVVSPGVDPDPRVAGKGFAALRAAGIDVVTGLLDDEARLANAGHVTRVAQGRPWVTLKLAVSRDGRIAGPSRATVAITGSQARARAHMLRATNDAILVGIGTVLADDPELTCRLPGMMDRSPVRVVLDSRFRTPPAGRLLATRQVAPVWIVGVAGTAREAAAGLGTAGADIVEAPAGSDGRLDPGAAMEALAARGITRVLVEGGAAIAGALLSAGLVDEVVIFTADMEIGAGGLDAIPGGGLAALGEGGAYRRVDERPVGADVMVTFLRMR